MTIFEAINIVIEMIGYTCIGALCIYLVIDYIQNKNTTYAPALKRAIEIIFLIGCLLCPIMPIIVGYIIVICATIGAVWETSTMTDFTSPKE